MRSERLCHHYSFMKDCLEKNIIPKGLLLEKTINRMRTRDAEGLESVNTQIRAFLRESSKQTLAKPVDYYDQTVIVEHEFLCSLNDTLADLRLLPDEHLDLDNFEANISLERKLSEQN